MLSKLALSAAALGGVQLVAAQEPAGYLISFGNSYTQTGFDINGAKASEANPLGNPDLPGWTTTGGLNWVGQLVTEFNNGIVYSYNFADGGATVDASIVPPYTETVKSLGDQIEIYSSTLATKPDYAPWTPENAVAAIWIGVNDVGNSWYQPDAEDITSRVVARYFELLQDLYATGLRQFALLNVPPTDRSPQMMGGTGEPNAQLAAIIASYNSQVASSLEQFSAANEGVTATVVDTQLPFNLALDDPTTYGSPDNVCTNEDGVSCLWHDSYHPGIQIQRLVAAQVAQTWGGFFTCVDSPVCST